ncbi:MAG TPA: restriction endonuclease subunit S [Rheinheimera sp.]|uniref:restriction endonuclease subunit S n=1 Tax=Rheinheimera sp. TaxID=1869214 RepID=UPI000EBB8C04|nr:restriction endonuclease subunit S [Rheinheimera sp.]HCU66953.1 restriction endonuclease subunit S [Rheinheimera sp.]
MNSNWPTLPLGELLELVIDHRGKTPNKMGFEDFHNSGYPVLSAKHVKTDSLVNLDSMRYSNEEMYKKWMKVEIQAGDIVLTSEAPLGEVYLLDGSTKFLLGQRVFGLRPNKNKINPLYLASWLASPKGQALLYARASGSTVLGIKQSELLKIEVDVAPEIYQNLIGINRFDIIKKIDVNNAICQTLESIAQALFKSWFVDFDPIKAKIEVLASGGSNADAELAAMSVIAAKDINQLDELRKTNPDAFARLARTAALFPAAMQDSELGEIPETWEVKQLKDILELAYGKALKKTDRVDGDVPVYGSGGLTGYHSQSLVDGPGIIVGRKGTVGSVYWEPKAFYPIDTVFYVRPKANYSLNYCHLVLQNLGLQNMNTDAAVPGLNRDNAYRLNVIAPTKGVMNIFKEIIQSLQSSIDVNNAQSASLESLRDTLLPKLLSGEINLMSEVVT